jgi:hypothetical protein
MWRFFVCQVCSSWSANADRLWSGGLVYVPRLVSSPEHECYRDRDRPPVYGLLCVPWTRNILDRRLAPRTTHARLPWASWRITHPQQTSRNDETEEAEHEKRRKEQAILRVLAAVGAAVPVRLMKRDLLFVIKKLVALMEEPRLEMLARRMASGKSEMTVGSARLLPLTSDAPTKVRCHDCWSKQASCCQLRGRIPPRFFVMRRVCIRWTPMPSPSR